MSARKLEVICRWMSKFHCWVYPECCPRLYAVTLCPISEFAPCPLPGGMSPCGNGLLSLANGVTPLSSELTSAVLMEEVGLLLEAPVISIPPGSHKMPYPPRITVCGVACHANPKRGPTCR